MKSFAAFFFCLLITAAAAAQSVQSAPPVSAEQVAAIYPRVESLYIDLHKSPELAFHEQQTAAKLADRVLPAPHSPQFAPLFQPTVSAAITAETAVLMDLLGG